MYIYTERERERKKPKSLNSLIHCLILTALNCFRRSLDDNILFENSSLEL